MTISLDQDSSPVTGAPGTCVCRFLEPAALTRKAFRNTRRCLQLERVSMVRADEI